MKSVFVAGGASYNSVVQLDEFPEPVGKTYHHCQYSEGIGSTGAGKSLNLAQLGFKVSLHTLLGKDEYKNKITQELTDNKINTLIDVDPLGTERHINILNKHGQRISIFTNPISDSIAIDLSRIEKLIKSSDYVVVNIYNYCKQILPLCKKHGVPVWTDLHDYNGGEYYREFIECSDFIFMSNENIIDPKKQVEAFIDKGKKLAVCTKAHQGAIAMNHSGECVSMEPPNDYVYKNSNGAGDAFFSGFLFAYSRGEDLKSCMDYAGHAAGTCIESKSLYSKELTADFLFQKIR